jgi:hypothetical protein
MEKQVKTSRGAARHEVNMPYSRGRGALNWRTSSKNS